MDKKEEHKASNRIEELKSKIYSRKAKIKKRPRSKIRGTDYHVSDTWQDTVVNKKKKKETQSLLGNSVFRKLFFGSVLFFIISALFGLYMFFGGSNTVSADNIDISILGNAFVSGGEELPLQIQISNRNNVALESSDILIEYQKGAGLGEDIYRQRIGIGDVSAGGITSELITVVLFGSQGSSRDIMITLEYRVPGSNAIFIKQKVYTVNISSTPVNLNISGPENIGSNQSMSFTVKVNLNTPNPVSNMLAVVNYPRGFRFESATPSPTFGDNIWALGDLTSGVEREIKINGSLVAEPGEQRAFNVYVGQALNANERQIGVQFNSQSHVVSIQRPLLDTRITVNNASSPEVVVMENSNLSVRIEWRNATGQRLTDVEIVAELRGPIINTSSVSSSTGFYESTTNRIIWNRQNYPAFADVPSGKDGTLSFNFRTLSASAGKEASIVLSVKAKNTANNEILDVRNYSTTVLKLSSNLQLVGHSLYYGGSFVNSGPLPPTPGQPTTYTISWSLANSINDVSGAEVRGKLPIYVDFVGTTSSNSESVTFNQSTKEVVWNVGNIAKNTGTTSAPREVQFQVRFNPSASHIGTSVPLVQDINYKGIDVYTNKSINRSIQNITHALNKDLNYNFQNDKVQ